MKEENAKKEKDGAVKITKEKRNIKVISIIGHIEGHYTLSDGQKVTKYEHIIPELVEAEEDENTDGVLILLNTVGGDVEAGLAISELISSMTKPKVTLVLGGGHSIGVPLAVSGDISFIVESATMTLHPVRYNGLVVGVEQSFRYFSEMQKRIVRFIVTHSNANQEDIYELMMRPDMLATDVGSVIEGREAVEHGIIDKIGGIGDALNELYMLIKKSSPNDRGR